MKPFLALTSLVVLLTSSLAAQDYAIKLHQPNTVGQRYEFAAIASESSEQSLTAEPGTPQTQVKELRVELESVATVLEVDSKGRPTKESHKIVKLLVGTNKEPALAAGTIVVASRPGRKMVFEIAGKPATHALTAALAMAMDIASSGPTDDEIFGTQERKKVGDTWPVNEPMALKDANEKLGASGMKIGSVKGATTLQKVSNDGGVEVKHLRANLDATIISEPNGPYTSAKGTMNATFKGSYPDDLTKSARNEEIMMTVVCDLSGQGKSEDSVLHLSGKSKRSTTRQYKLLK